MLDRLVRQAVLSHQSVTTRSQRVIGRRKVLRQESAGKPPVRVARQRGIGSASRMAPNVMAPMATGAGANSSTNQSENIRPQGQSH